MNELTLVFLGKIAGWETVTEAKNIVAAGRVTDSAWNPPLLRGTVLAGSITYRAGLVIKDEINIENLCRCPPSQTAGVICVHSVAVALRHVVHPDKGPGAARETAPAVQTAAIPAKLSRIQEWRAAAKTAANPPGRAGLRLVFPPKLREAIERGKIMVCLQWESAGRRREVSDLSPGAATGFSEQDWNILERMEAWGGGVCPANALLGLADFCELLSLLKNHEGLSAGKFKSVEVKDEPIRINVEGQSRERSSLRAEAHSSGGLLTFSGRQGGWVFDERTYEFRPLV